MSIATPDAPDTPLVAASGLACVRGGRLVFDAVGFAIGPGEALQVHGANGTGKSSLLRMIAGLLSPAAGLLSVNGRIALCDERLALDRDAPLVRALDFWTIAAGAASHRTETAMAALAIDHLGEVPVRYLSTGQRQRARLARVAASDANLWLLDEPLNGLDVDAVGALGELVAGHLAAGGAVLASSHVPLPFTIARGITLCGIRP